MTGNRHEQYYLSKYGEIDGATKYQRAAAQREKRARRVGQGRNLVLGFDLENEIELGNALRCLACGYIGTRLQWTHFRNKCSIRSIGEYKIAFPEAPLVAPTLKRRISITLENMIAVYGDNEGKSKWQQYCYRQAESNTLDYKARKYGWNQEDFNAYNSNRSVTRENLMARHGVEDGQALWDCYRDRQRYTNTLGYFIEREGNKDVGLEKWLLYNDEKGSSRRVPDIAKARGISLDEASNYFPKCLLGSSYRMGNRFLLRL